MATFKELPTIFVPVMSIFKIDEKTRVFVTCEGPHQWPAIIAEPGEYRAVSTRALLNMETRFFTGDTSPLWPSPFARKAA